MKIKEVLSIINRNKKKQIVTEKTNKEVKDISFQDVLDNAMSEME